MQVVPQVIYCLYHILCIPSSKLGVVLLLLFLIANIMEVCSAPLILWMQKNECSIRMVCCYIVEMQLHNSHAEGCFFDSSLALDDNEGNWKNSTLLLRKITRQPKSTSLLSTLSKMLLPRRASPLVANNRVCLSSLIIGSAHAWPGTCNWRLNLESKKRCAQEQYFLVCKVREAFLWQRMVSWCF